jgi:hypothetical protein
LRGGGVELDRGGQGEVEVVVEGEEEGHAAAQGGEFGLAGGEAAVA